MERDNLAKIIDKLKKVRIALGVMDSKISDSELKAMQFEPTTNEVNLYSEQITPAQFVSAVVTGGSDSNSVYALPFTYNNNLILKLFKVSNDTLVPADSASRTVIVHYK